MLGCPELSTVIVPALSWDSPRADCYWGLAGRGIGRGAIASTDARSAGMEPHTAAHNGVGVAAGDRPVELDDGKAMVLRISVSANTLVESFADRPEFTQERELVDLVHAETGDHADTPIVYLAADHDAASWRRVDLHVAPGEPNDPATLRIRGRDGGGLSEYRDDLVQARIVNVAVGPRGQWQAVAFVVDNSHD